MDKIRVSPPPRPAAGEPTGAPPPRSAVGRRTPWPRSNCRLHELPVAVMRLPFCSTGVLRAGLPVGAIGGPSMVIVWPRR